MSVLIIGFLLISAVGAAYSGAMMSHGDMTGCPLTGYSAAACNTNLLQHLSIWQSMFTAIPAPILLSVLLLLLTAFFFVRFRQFLWLLHPPLQPIRIWHDPDIGTHDPLRLFMARGLLHPKIF